MLEVSISFDVCALRRALFVILFIDGLRRKLAGTCTFRVRVRIRGRVWVRVVNMFGVMVMVRVNTTQNLNPNPQNEIVEGHN